MSGQTGRHVNSGAALLDLRREAELLVSHDELQRAMDRLAVQLNAHFADVAFADAAGPPLALCVMNGGVVFTGQLLPRLTFPLALDYLHATRYRGTTEGGELELRSLPSCSLAGRHVLLLDDIFDGGATLKEIHRWCRAQGAGSVRSAVLMDKRHERKVGGFRPDWCGLEVEDRYVFGFGMDYHELYRNLPAVYALRSA